MALTFLSLVFTHNNEPEYNADGTEVLCNVLNPDETMTYAFVEVKELKSKGISLPISTVSPAYKKLKNCNEESRESSDDDQTDWKPKTDNHCVKIKKTLFDCFDEYISSHDEDSHSIHIVGGCKQKITEENNEIIWTSSLTKALISELIERDSLFQRPSCKKIKLWRSIAIKLKIK